MNVQEQKEIYEVLYKILNKATKTIKEIGEVFALLAKKQEESDNETRRSN